jgi:predicted nucleic acid-binding protein
MRVVSNTSPISNLAMVGRLRFLREQMQIVLIPKAVFLELQRLEDLQAKETIHSAIADGWIQVETLKDETLVNVLGTSLDAGEA